MIWALLLTGLLESGTVEWDTGFTFQNFEACAEAGVVVTQEKNDNEDALRARAKQQTGADAITLNFLRGTSWRWTCVPASQELRRS